MMYYGPGKSGSLRNFLVQLFLFCVLFVALRFAYVVIIRGESCDVTDFCFFSIPQSFSMGQSSSPINIPKTTSSKLQKLPDLWSTEGFKKSVTFYSSVFGDLLSDVVLRPDSKTVCIDTAIGGDVFALREIGVEDSIGISKKGFKPLVVSGLSYKQPFTDQSFDFVFCGDGVVERALRPGDVAAEIERTMKPEGFLVVRTRSNDSYSFESLLSLFNFCRLVKSRDINISGLDSQVPYIPEIVLQKISGNSDKSNGDSANKCSVPGYKHELIKKAESLIEEEPKKPWITLKKNAEKIKHLSSMVDISFKSKYVYIDVGSRSYGSSIVSWFKKQYPKQNKTFDIYAIEADKAFHEEHKYKKGVSLLPYAAWVKNETLFFEINEDPGNKKLEKGRGMGRIKPVQSSDLGDVDEIQGFDFAEWLKSMVSERVCGDENGCGRNRI